MHSLLRRHPIFKRHHQATRETLQRYRDVAPLCIWVVVLSYPVGMFLYVSGLPFLVVVALFAVVTSAAVFYFFHLREQVDKADVLCPWEGEEDEHENLASIQITEAWVCGFCGKSHPRFNFLPWRQTFLDVCENSECKARQHSIICWRCRQPIVWDEDAFRRRPNTSAWLPDYPPLLPEPEPEPGPEPVPEDRPPRIIDEDLR